MKYIWEEKDITCGRYICRDPEREAEFKPSGWNSKWTFKIGYVNGSSSDGIALICMSDGMVTSFESKEALVARLNKDEMIPMPHSWLMRSMDYMQGWYSQ